MSDKYYTVSIETNTREPQSKTVQIKNGKVITLFTDNGISIKHLNGFDAAMLFKALVDKKDELLNNILSVIPCTDFFVLKIRGESLAKDKPRLRQVMAQHLCCEPEDIFFVDHFHAS